MRSMTSPFWKSRTVPLDSLTAMATAPVARLMAAAGPVAGPQALAQRDLGGGGGDVLARRDDRPIRRHDKRPVELGDFFDRFANLRIFQPAFVDAVAAHRIESQRVAMFEHFAMIAHDEQRADRLAFAPFTADVHRQINRRS